ncbi:MAG: hypothetical protein OXG19_01200 [Chloroflexi bacterium]|nr:hypothetical protein [Chloroflexota bacterium]
MPYVAAEMMGLHIWYCARAAGRSRWRESGDHACRRDAGFSRSAVRRVGAVRGREGGLTGRIELWKRQG